DGVTHHVYRTGDLVKRRANGELEFVGRIDDQVKLRGYRIELGEIESQLQAHPQIAAVSVIVRQDTPGDKRLVGYIVPTDSTSTRIGTNTNTNTTSPSTKDLRTFLALTLPEYMVPAAFVTLEALPLTPNGKVDRKALPAPDPRERGRDDTYTPPRTELEHTLAAIWSEILGVTPVGIHDNFFHLGGDSIVSIQMIARAKKRGLHLTPRMIFKYQTVAEIAPQVRTEAVIDAEQGPVTGDVLLTPIQQWFLEKRLPAQHHFNQAELLVTEGLDADTLAAAIGDVVTHHDALRLRYRRDTATGAWTQHLGAAVPATGLVQTHDLTAVPDADLPAAMQRIGDATQQSFDLTAGPLLRSALMNLGTRSATQDDGDPTPSGQRLLIAVHHLAIDSVSWRVLLEDLGAAYAARALGQVPALPDKTTSFKAWADKLAAHAVSDRARAEFAYWAEPKPGHRLPRDHADGANTGDSADTVRVSLDPQETGALLRDVPRAFATRINDALLTAIAHAVGGWTGRRRTLIGLEGHGREDLFADTDLSRTVGWFTSVFPVVLDADPAADPVDSLAAVQAQLARIPDNGVGYGVLRYLGAGDTAPVLQAQPYPEINVNYLGRFAETLPGIGRYADPAESRGRSASPHGPRWNVLDVTGAVEGDVFRLYLTFSAALHDRATVERLAADILAVLRRLIEAAAQDPAERTRADRATEGTALTDVSDSDLAAILKRFSV
ncbi:MAG TPA: condensation domain-containing protein, partial [Actinocrinis sp.]|nr:condensation domain-containing protein [Actinocrinis sp.]